MPASINVVENFLLARNVSAKKYQEIMSQLKKLSTANIILSDQDLIIILEEIAPDLFEAVKKAEENDGLSIGSFPIRDYIPKLQTTLDEERSWIHRLFAGASQVMVIAQQIPNGTYPPKFSERVEIKIYEDRVLAYSVQTEEKDMSIGYGALVLAVYEHAKTLQKRKQRRVKNILTKFCSHYFDQSNLVRASRLEDLQRA